MHITAIIKKRIQIFQTLSFLIVSFLYKLNAIYYLLKERNFFIRADSGIEIGSGHIMRCYALAEILKNMDFNVYFISRKLKGNICDFITAKGYKVYYIPTKSKNKKQNKFSKNNKKTIEKDALETMKIITNHNDKPSWLLVDHYDLDMQWESLLRKFVKKIIAVDDLANRKHDCDLLLDQNLYEHMNRRYTGLVPKNCKKLLGPNYTLLRSEFPKLRKTIIKRKKLQNILVSFGGSDPRNETAKALQAIKTLRKNLTVDVVVGNINPHKGKIKKLCSSLHNTTFYSNIDTIGELMSKAHLAIGTGGITTWERCCLGLPSIVSITSGDQAEAITLLDKKNCVINLGNFQNLTYRDYAEAIKKMNNKIIAKMSANCMKIVDGLGCFRVAEIINSL